MLGQGFLLAYLANTLKEGVAESTVAQLDDPVTLAKTIYHLWLGASLVASLSHNDTSLNAAMRATEALVPRP